MIENETRTDWESLIYRMKQEFVKYPKEVKWDLTVGHERIPSTASQGNILEAINITLNLLHLHYIDRDLHRTGMLLTLECYISLIRALLVPSECFLTSKNEYCTDVATLRYNADRKQHRHHYTR